MKNKTFFFLIAFLNTAALFAQSDNQATDDRLQAARLNNPNISPLMMFSGDEKSPTDTTTDPRSTASRDVSPRGAASAESSSDAARGTSSGLAEEWEDEGALTLDHFRIALAQNPTSKRFVIVDDEEKGISIEPRVAATSKFALKKNQGENTTIIDELRSLLVTRHGGSTEIVASFFDALSGSEDMTLSAERLQEILRKSDAAQKPLSFKKSAAPKIPPPSASEHDATSALDDSNVDEYLGADIRKHTHTIEKINLAESLSDKSNQAVADFKKLQKDQKAAMRKKREQKVLESALESDTEGYMTPGTFLKSAVLKTAQAEMASSLLQGFAVLPTSRDFLNFSSLPHSPEVKKVSAAERDIEGYKHLAEEKRSQALAASLAAKKIKNKKPLAKEDFELERAAYAAAEEAWNDIVVPYETALDVVADATMDTSEITTLLYAAQANELYWRANLVRLEARKAEHAMPSFLNETQSSEIEAAWAKTIHGYEAALAKAKEAAIKNSEWMTDLTNAQTQQTTWAAKTAEFKFTREATEAEQVKKATQLQNIITNINTPAEAVFARAKELKNNKEAWDEAIQTAKAASSSWSQELQASSFRTTTASVSLSVLAIGSSHALMVEEMEFQKSRWEQKAIIAEIRGLAIQACSFSRKAMNALFYPVLEVARKKTTPLLLDSMENFINYPSAVTMEKVRRAAAAYAYVYASAYNFASKSTYDLSNFSAFAAAYASISAANYTSISASFTASAFVYAHAAAAAYIRASDYSGIRTLPSVYISASAAVQGAAYAYAYASASIYALASEALEASENVVKLYDDLKNKLKDRELISNNSESRAAIEDAILVTQKTAAFARAVTLFKEIQERQKAAPVWQELEQPAVIAFAHARDVKNNVSWKEASVAAERVLANWNDIVENKKAGRATLACSLEEAEDQRSRWEQKAVLAKIKAAETDPSISSCDLDYLILTLAQTESWPAMKRSMEEFIAHPYKTIGTHNIHLIESADIADVMEMMAEDVNDIPMNEFHQDHDYMFDVTQTTARFLRAIVEFKKR